MERIASLVEQLQKALNNNAPPSQLLGLTNMLQVELQQLLTPQPAQLGTNKVAVVLPASRITEPLISQPLPAPKQDGQVEKIMEVLHVSEEEVEAELEEIRRKAEFAQKMEAQAKQVLTKPVLLFGDEPEIPTLIHQPNYREIPKNKGQEINEIVVGESPSLNDRLKQQTIEIGHKLSETTAVKDLKKAIGINDRFVFINELFRGDEVMYERSIKTINNFSIYPEAQYWMERELKIKLGWNDSLQSVKDFYALVKRRFS